MSFLVDSLEFEYDLNRRAIKRAKKELERLELEQTRILIALRNVVKNERVLKMKGKYYVEVHKTGQTLTFYCHTEKQMWDMLRKHDLLNIQRIVICDKRHVSHLCL